MPLLLRDAHSHPPPHTVDTQRIARAETSEPALATEAFDSDRSYTERVLVLFARLGPSVWS